MTCRSALLSQLRFTISTISSLSIVLALSLWSSLSWAHFQLVYSPSYILDKPGNIPTKLIFWHPMANGHAMPMDKPEEILVYHRGDVQDISDNIQPNQFQGVHNQVASWDLQIPVRRAGDYIVVVTPQPYYEELEDIYIQQITKAYFNRKQLPTDWDTTQGLKTEIKPLVKPYNVLAGTSFSGVVLSDGEPVPFAEIEVEFMVAEPNMNTNRVDTEASIDPPGGSMAIQSNEQGVFSMALPKAGYWGFAALGAGPDTEYQGKPLSQDAVIWVQVHPWP